MGDRPGGEVGGAPGDSQAESIDVFGWPARDDERNGRSRRVRLHGVDVRDGGEVHNEGRHGAQCGRRKGWAVAGFELLELAEHL